ncbi:protein aurora borealis [Limosa lapponica baueri]|uniref:Protein aurora borealis n=1 Tax=Limosa lapponica baueri TaxID=1758121 RepID=A0A2I0TXM8_LIMLA|nr:protein aurora borealis [Limosa lapponica baueri]
MQITPETPGRVTILNPFESPSDYYTLQEQIVSSPSVFKSTNSSSTPGKFRWSIDQLALINPVEIDSEDVRRQAMYLSHARIDKETEDRRQKAIEEFFTKRLIVPSPWTEHEGKQVSQFNSTKSIDLNNISPIGRQLTLQPGKSNDQRKFTFRSPDIPSSSNRMTPPSTRSPYIDGCSPIKNCSPMRLGACRGTTQYQTSVIRIPIAVENHGEDEEDKENVSPAEARFPETDNRINLCQQDGDTFARGTRLVVATVSIAPDHSEGCHQRLSSLRDIEGSKENNTVDMADAAEVSEENTWIKETIGNSNAPMTSFMTGITFSIESSRMCMSPLAESSAIPCDNSSIQVDSGYNTQTCGSSIMDTAGAETNCRENDMNTNVFQSKSQLLRTKVKNRWMVSYKPLTSNLEVYSSKIRVAVPLQEE